MAALDDAYEWWDAAQRRGFHDELSRMRRAIAAELRRIADERWARMLASETPEQREKRISTPQERADSMRSAMQILKEFYT